MTWTELITNHQQSPITHSLRGRSEGTFQFREGADEFLVVNSLQPYGSLTAANGDSAAKQYLLTPQAQAEAEDFTVFSIPEEMLSLRAVLLGTGSRNIHLLREAFRHVGRIAASVLEDDVVDRLGLGDFSVSRETGKVMVLPPVRFSKHNDDEPSSYQESVLQPMREDLSVLHAHSVDYLISVIEKGIDYGRPA